MIISTLVTRHLLIQSHADIRSTPNQGSSYCTATDVDIRLTPNKASSNCTAPGVDIRLTPNKASSNCTATDVDIRSTPNKASSNCTATDVDIRLTPNKASSNCTAPGDLKWLQMQAGLTTQTVYKYFHPHTCLGHCINTYATDTFLNSNISSFGHNHVGSLFTAEE